MGAAVHIEKKSLVLLVEDDAVMRVILRHVLAEKGCEVLMAENGEAAIALLKNATPDLVITDMMMPVMDGYMLVDIIRKSARLAKVPIVAVTVAGEGEKRQWAMMLGVNKIIPKPVDPGVFYREIAPFIEFSNQ